uniref:Poly(A) polymerase RNA-binding domain-containing protein n=1 Tax=Meloidogyne floridensis TaxID=298350 RepID=A0A915NK27_9BILA
MYIFYIGLKGIRQIRRQSSTNFNEGLKQWIKGVDFVDKYNHFVTIICVGIDKNIGEDFCNFVKNRIRVELVLSLEEYPKLEYSHISPNKSKKGKWKTIGVNNGLLHRKIERTNVTINLRYTDIHEAKKFWGDN